jgi:oxygen-independent coproporphyrinogen-3 oxidase
MSAWGIYIHIPFCPYQCIYCDFDAGVYPQRVMPEYVEALLKEIAFTRTHSYPDGLTADTIYFGGGTPSLLASDHLERILQCVRQHFTIREHAEITIEANPESMTQEKAQQLKRIGVNRISVGVQSFIDQELRLLGRGHTAEEVWTSFAHLRAAGFNNLNLDLIGGLPGQSLEHWLDNLDQAFALRPDHLSMYLLEVHEGTMLAQLLQRGRLPQPDDELSVNMYDALLERAQAEGYQHYELSNYCLPGFHSRHNLKYWSDIPYLGFGCSAASYDGLERRVNVRTPGQYIDRINKTGQATETQTPVTPEIQRQEALFLGLRRIQGVDLNQFEARYGIDVWTEYGAELQPLLEAGLVSRDNGCLRLTRQGLTLSNEVFAVFV